MAFGMLWYGPQNEASGGGRRLVHSRSNATAYPATGNASLKTYERARACFRRRAAAERHTSVTTMGSVHVSQAMNVVGWATIRPVSASSRASIEARSRRTSPGANPAHAAARATLEGNTLMASRLGYRTPKSIMSSGKAPSDAAAMPAATSAAGRPPTTDRANRRHPNGQNTAARTMLVILTASGTLAPVAMATRVATAFQPAG